MWSLIRISSLRMNNKISNRVLDLVSNHLLATSSKTNMMIRKSKMKIRDNKMIRNSKMIRTNRITFRMTRIKWIVKTTRMDFLVHFRLNRMKYREPMNPIYSIERKKNKKPISRL